MSRRPSVRAVALVQGLLCCRTAAAQEERPVPKATVSLSIRNPRGRALANAPIEVLPGYGVYPFQAPAPVKIQTDGNCLARFSWPTGLNQLRVVVPGVGFGATGRSS